jgi:cytosine/adenosine deaminase-related metal-dependent hydrolase
VALTALALDFSDCVTLAGAVNAHTHLYSGLAPLGMPAPERAPATFLEILQRVWWRLDRALDEASLRAAARLYIAESLLAGTTALIDHHESPAFIEGSLDVLADAAHALGCRLVTGFGATERNGGRDEARRGLAECRRFVVANRSPLVRGMVALHASFTVSDDTVLEAAALARELGVPVHVHIAEDRADVDDARARGWAGPLERLTQLGALPPGSVIAHGVHLTEPEVASADGARVWIVHNPRSNVGNHVGWARSLGASTRVALGTDGYPADMRAEADVLVSEARAAGASVDVAARVAGSRRLAGERFASDLAQDLVAWRSADDAARPGATPRHVVVAGEVVVRDGRLARADIDEVRAHAREQAARLWIRMNELGDHP